MRQVVITRHGGPEVLVVKDRPDPVPQPHEVVIKVKAAGINFADVLARKGLYPDAPKPPCVVGYEIAGEIIALGKDVASSSTGKQVLALTRFNGYSAVLAVPAVQVFDKPDSLSFEEAAALPVNYLTAFQLLVVMGSLRAGEAVLIHNAGGGVGLAALDIARHIGAVIYGTASSSKHEFLKARGVHHVIDYRREDWLRVIKDLTGGRGVELIIDPIGGAHWKKCYRGLRSSGRLGMFGISTTTETGRIAALQLLKLVLRMPWFNPVALMNTNRSVFGVNLGHMWHEGEKVRGWMMELLAGVKAGWIRPHVDCSFPFEQAAQAHAYLEQRRNIGKVVLRPEMGVEL